jgi:hypothetical protein
MVVSRSASFIGPSFGITLLLRDNESDYMPRHAQTAGFRVGCGDRKL